MTGLPPLIVVSLKMYLGVAATRAWVADLAGVGARLDAGASIELAVLPTFPLLESTAKTLAGTGIRWGAQDVAASADGAQTGEDDASIQAKVAQVVGQVSEPRARRRRALPRPVRPRHARVSAGRHRSPHQRPEPRRITHVEQGALMNANPIPVKKTAVVTGAGSTAGIGRTVALTLAEGGWHVALIDNNAEGLTEVEKDLVDSGHENVLAIPTDITSKDSVAAAFAAIDEKLPPVVALVNLAGIACPVALHEVELEEFERVMAVNVTGSYLMLKAAAERMIPRGVGRIVNTSSITAFDGGGTFSKGVYATAKAAVIGMCRGGARELGPFGITVNVLAPGPIDTQIMGGKLTDERKASMSSTIPLGRVGQPEEIAATVAFLLTDGAGYINGATIQIDGGKYMH